MTTPSAEISTVFARCRLGCSSHRIFVLFRCPLTVKMVIQATKNSHVVCGRRSVQCQMKRGERGLIVGNDLYKMKTGVSISRKTPSLTAARKAPRGSLLDSTDVTHST